MWIFLKSITLPRIARQVREDRLTYLSVDKLASLAKEITRIKDENIHGDFIELGVALGGSAIFIASEAKGRRFVGYDVFGMIPPPSEKDESDSHMRYERIKTGGAKGLKGDQYYGYVNDLYSKVTSEFARYGLPIDQQSISLIRGLFQDTLVFQETDIIAMAHIDCDWYEPVQLSLNRIIPRLAKGGVIIIDDYNDYEGCRKAVDERLRCDSRIKLVKKKPHAIISRVS